MAWAAQQHHISLPDRELACAPIQSELGQRYLGAMRAAINCALANRQILTQDTRDVFARFFPSAHLSLLYDVSHNTCKVEEHEVDGRARKLFVHRKGATRAFGSGHPSIPQALRKDLPGSLRPPLWYWLLIPAVFILFQLFVETPSSLIYPPLMAERKGYSESTAQAIDAEIEKLLDEAYALLEKETLERAALDGLLKGRGAGVIRRVGSADY